VVLRRIHPALSLLPTGIGKLHLRGPNVSLTMNDSNGSLLDVLSGTFAGVPDDEPRSKRLNKVIHSLSANGLAVTEEEAANIECLSDSITWLIDLFARQTTGQSDATFAMHKKIQIRGSGLLADHTTDHLKRLGFVVSRFADQADVDAENARGEKYDLVVVCADREDHPMLLGQNEQLVRRAEPAFYACLTEAGVRIGPAVLPEGGACYNCFYSRLRNGMHFTDEFDTFTRSQTTSASKRVAPSDLLSVLGASLLAVQVSKLMAGLSHDANIASVHEFNLMPLRLRQGELLRLPRCTVCGTGRATEPVQAIRDRRFWKPV
jgi:bacteriocin biosynthesis cyclodehydratase domain-containing protein